MGGGVGQGSARCRGGAPGIEADRPHGARHPDRRNTSWIRLRERRRRRVERGAGICHDAAARSGRVGGANSRRGRLARQRRRRGSAARQQPGSVPMSRGGVRRLGSVALTGVIFILIARRVPLPALAGALRDANLSVFLALMVPNTLFYFAWDTLLLAVVIRWFHGEVRYRDLLPVRAASYAVGFFNTNLGRGAM